MPSIDRRHGVCFERARGTEGLSGALSSRQYHPEVDVAVPAQPYPSAQRREAQFPNSRITAGSKFRGVPSLMRCISFLRVLPRVSRITRFRGERSSIRNGPPVEFPPIRVTRSIFSPGRWGTKQKARRLPRRVSGFYANILGAGALLYALRIAAMPCPPPMHSHSA